jgi:hypothetical protein
MEPDSNAEAWAREHVHLFTTDHHKNGLTWVAQISAEGLTFEGRATGPARKREALGRARAMPRSVTTLTSSSESRAAEPCESLSGLMARL